MKPTYLNSLAGIGALAILAALPGVGCAANFAGAGAAIPDNNPGGANITFNVSGITGKVGRVSIGVNLTHTFVGDLKATLVSPGGTARLVLFSRAGYKRNNNLGVSANLSGNYVFDDLAASDFWQNMASLTTAQNVPPGTFRTSTGGQVSLSDHGGCSTYLSLAFGGLTPAQTNGTWTLNVADLANGDTGQVNSALLSIDPAVQLFASGFEDAGPGPTASNVRGSCRKAYFDYSGNGLSDYTVVRNTGGGANGAMSWFIKLNDGTANGALQSFVHGTASDIFVDGDFDGDGIADASFFRPSLGMYFVRRSSRPSDSVLLIPLGQSIDDVNKVGDYDGDGISDPAVYRQGASAGLPSTTLVRLSSSGLIRSLVTGENGAFASGGADFTGDGRADMAIQSNAGGGVARFRLFDGTSGALQSDFTFGTPSDVILTANYTGSALADVTVIRGVGGAINWTTRDTATGVGQPSVVLGNTATDFALNGDFDGDGLHDYAVWRPNASAGQSRFIVGRSASAGAQLEVFHGETGDYPVANSRTD